MKSKNSIPSFSFKERRRRNILCLLVVVALIGIVIYAQNQTLQHGSFTSGYVLLGSIIFLTLFNLRKKLTFLPVLGSAAMWMQLHIYVGLATFVIFGFHISWQIPNGMFEGFLAFLYLTVALSGVYGLYVTRRAPRQLTGLKEEVIYERIPLFRVQLARQTRSLVIKACESTDVLAKFYANQLSAFFEKPRGLAYQLSPSGRRKRYLMNEIQNLDRYLADDQRHVTAKLKEMVQMKDDLDYHAAMQGRLKLWLFVHIGLTYSLLIVGMLHGVMAHAFSGGLQ